MMLDAFRRALAAAPMPFEYRVPQHSPDVGAALYAARLAGAPLAKHHALRSCNPV